MTRWTKWQIIAAIVLAGLGTSVANAVADQATRLEIRHEDEARIRDRGVTLEQAEQTLFDPNTGLAKGTTQFEARFERLSLTAKDQETLLTDVEKLQGIPVGSEVRFRGRIDGRPFRVEVRNHHGQVRVEARGLRFASRQEAKAFVDTLRAGGADRVRLRGTIDGQRFDARLRTEDGRVTQQFRVERSGHQAGAVTTASGRTMTVGAGENHRGGDSGTRLEVRGLDRSGSGSSGGGRAGSMSSGGSSGSGFSGSGISGGSGSSGSGSGSSGSGGHGRR